MESPEITKITVEVDINASVELVWACFNTPEHVVKWNAASDDWHTRKHPTTLEWVGNSTIEWKPKTGVLDLILLAFTVKLLKIKKIAMPWKMVEQ